MVPAYPASEKKTAVKLIGKFGTIANLLKHVDTVDARKVRENLSACGDQALLSRQLVTLDSGVPLSYRSDDLKAAPPDREKLKELFKELEFTTFLQAITPATASDTQHYHLVTSREACLQLLSLIGKAWVPIL